MGCESSSGLTAACHAEGCRGRNRLLAHVCGHALPRTGALQAWGKWPWTMALGETNWVAKAGTGYWEVMWPETWGYSS